MNDQSSNPIFPSDQKKEVGLFPFELDRKCGNEHMDFIPKETGEKKCQNISENNTNPTSRSWRSTKRRIQRQ